MDGFGYVVGISREYVWGENMAWSDALLSVVDAGYSTPVFSFSLTSLRTVWIVSDRTVSYRAIVFY